MTTEAVNKFVLRQILKNQLVIMDALRDLLTHGIEAHEMLDERVRTLSLLGSEAGRTEGILEGLKRA